MPCGHGPPDFLYQRDGEIIAFARPDLAVAGTSLSSAAPVVDTTPGIRARAAPASAMKNGHCKIQIQPLMAEPGQYRFVERHNYLLSSSALRGSSG
jgi:hypothetical protein